MLRVAANSLQAGAAAVDLRPLVVTMLTRQRTIPAIINSRITGAVTSVLLIVGASAVIALAAQIAIPVPLSPVPLTMQPLAVLLVGATLGMRRGAAAAALYLMEGATGLPVFAQGHGGAIWLMGPTAGYLWSYPFAAALAGWFSERGWGSRTVRAVAGMFCALAVIYAGGWAWLAILAGPAAAFKMGIVPFLLADIIKVAFGAALLPWAERLVGEADAAP
ncbi:MAG TPA: biotin transporter BioY [Thermoanaerobaculia bacterium]|nr:biotin transporter BioY [Thermoanaerobaculia bacterium]